MQIRRAKLDQIVRFTEPRNKGLSLLYLPMREALPVQP